MSELIHHRGPAGSGGGVVVQRGQQQQKGMCSGRQMPESGQSEENFVTARLSSGQAQVLFHHLPGSGGLWGKAHECCWGVVWVWDQCCFRQNKITNQELLIALCQMALPKFDFAVITGSTVVSASARHMMAGRAG